MFSVHITSPRITTIYRMHEDAVVLRFTDDVDNGELTIIASEKQWEQITRDVDAFRRSDATEYGVDA